MVLNSSYVFMIISCLSSFKFICRCAVSESWFRWSTLPPFVVGCAIMITDVWLKLPGLFECGSASEEPRKPGFNHWVNLSWIMGYLINSVEPRMRNRTMEYCLFMLQQKYYSFTNNRRLARLLWLIVIQVQPQSDQALIEGCLIIVTWYVLKWHTMLTVWMLKCDWSYI